MMFNQLNYATFFKIFEMIFNLIFHTLILSPFNDVLECDFYNYKNPNLGKSGKSYNFTLILPLGVWRLKENPKLEWIC